MSRVENSSPKNDFDLQKSLAVILPTVLTEYDKIFPGLVDEVKRFDEKLKSQTEQLKQKHELENFRNLIKQNYLPQVTKIRTLLGSISSDTIEDHMVKSTFVAIKKSINTLVVILQQTTNFRVTQSLKDTISKLSGWNTTKRNLEFLIKEIQKQENISVKSSDSKQQEIEEIQEIGEVKIRKKPRNRRFLIQRQLLPSLLICKEW